MTKIYLTCGTGGVGKTTTSAAMGIAFAKQGLKTIILTIDPARRLADSLHLPELHNSISSVPIPNVQLDALMLDASKIFESFAKKHSSVAEFQELQSNRYYRFARDKMGGIQEYMAVLQMIELFDSGHYDVIVIDTPPARNAIQFLEAPQRIQQLLSRSALRWLTSSDSGLLSFSFGSNIIGKGLKRFLGAQTIADISRFFTLFSKVAQQLEQSAETCASVLSGNSAHFWLVTVPSLSNDIETLTFVKYIIEQRYNFSGIICNKMPALPKKQTVEQQQYLQENPSLQSVINHIEDRSVREYREAQQHINNLKFQSDTTVLTIPKLQHLDSLAELITLSQHLTLMSR